MGGEQKMGIPYEGFAEYVRKMAAEGAVLLQNEGNVLPLKEQDTVAVFGRMQIDYYRCGTGSGGAVKVAYTTNLLGSLREHKEICLNETVANVYEQWVKEHPMDHGNGGWASEPWNQQEMPLDEKLVEEQSKVSEKAIIVIGRTAGEDQDNADVGGSFRLTECEYEMIRKVTTYFKKTVVVLNVSNIIDMSWVKDKSFVFPIGAVIYVWHGGNEGGNAAADVLTGVVSPSGKLTDTIADCLDSYPSTKNYGGMEENLYEEDIYVGYRYFETFAPKKVLYEFGYGMSYTKFQIKVKEAKQIKDSSDRPEFDQIQLMVEVKNLGDRYSGKEVVQVYYEAPQGKLGQPVRQLVAFAKTKELVPGEIQELIISIPVSRMASYDDSGVTGAPYCYVLEAGEYKFHVGNSVRNTCQIFIDGKSFYEVKELLVVEKLDQVLAPIRAFSRMKPGKRNMDGTYQLEYESVPQIQYSLKERIEANLPQTIPQTGNQGIKLQAVADGTATMEEFIAQLSNEDLATIVRAEGMNHPSVTAGTAAAFGGVGDRLYEYGIPIACGADGPSGIRMGADLKATLLPIGTALAATWNLEGMEELYTLEGKEMLRNEIDTLLGPGLNLRRSPMNGRNFEYYSEDPLITGMMGSAAVRGIDKSGSHATIKHFAGNNQEKNRFRVETVASERALREIYLKGFEMAVREGNAKSVMTSYNPINGHWAASNYDLCTTVLRKEWGFTGMVMTDWWARMNDPIAGGPEDMKHTGFMVRAGNDVYMVVNNFGAEINATGDDTLEKLETGELTVGELQQSAMNICRFIMDSPVFGRKQLQRKQPEKIKAKTSSTKDALDNVTTIFGEDTTRYPNRVTPCEQGITHLFVEKDGIYRVVISMRSETMNWAQSTTEIIINDVNLFSVTTNGTMGYWMNQRLGQVELSSGEYELRTQVVKAGMEIGWISFERMDEM